MRRQPNGPVVLRVYCDVCTASRRGDRGEVGWVQTEGHRCLSWRTQNPRRLRRPGQPVSRAGLWAGEVLRHPDFPDLDVPERLPAYCRHHGWRSVATTDVMAAVYARQANAVLTSAGT